MNDRRLVEGLLGFEYDAGCWIGRVVLEKVNSSLTSSTKRIMFQLELVGLSRLGSSPLRSLRNSIPHYQLLRQETTSPSRFTDYE
jgi:LPS-assembly protein